MIKFEDERAFPIGMPGPGDSTITNLGVTVRDYFAAKVISAFLRDFLPERAAKEAYKVADAMLAERDK